LCTGGTTYCMHGARSVSQALVCCMFIRAPVTYNRSSGIKRHVRVFQRSCRSDRPEPFGCDAPGVISMEWGTKSGSFGSHVWAADLSSCCSKWGPIYHTWQNILCASLCVQSQFVMVQSSVFPVFILTLSALLSQLGEEGDEKLQQGRSISDM